MLNFAFAHRLYRLVHQQLTMSQKKGISHGIPCEIPCDILWGTDEGEGERILEDIARHRMGCRVICLFSEISPSPVQMHF